MGIVGEGDSQSQTVAEHGCHRDDTLPRQVCCILDTPRDRTGTRTAQPDGADILVAAVVLYQHDNLLTKCGHKVINVWIIGRGEGIFRQDVTSYVNNCIGGQLITDVNTHYF